VTRYPPPPDWAHQLRTVGVTGTNGKTSTAWLLAAALAEPGSPTPALTTLGFSYAGATVPIEQHVAFVGQMKRARDAGATRAVLEMTSLALANGAAAAWPFVGAVFTNFTRDHLDLHATAEHYLASKAQLFAHLAPGGFAVLNADSPVTPLLAEVIRRGVEVQTYGQAPGADIGIADIAVAWTGTTVRLRSGPEQRVLSIPLVGRHFGLNAVAAWTAARALGASPERAAEQLATAPYLPGRFERVWERPHVVVDYAHSPDAMIQTVATARHLARGARVIVVFGAAGGTDPGHRPAFARAAAEADRLVITTDNPREEDPAAIAAQLRAALPGENVTMEADRSRAIAIALREAGADDVVVIAGKGHETVQIVGSTKRPWSDREAVVELMGGSR
jgi:UDP-N-acetylmuramoyl-L-alanyl-D-glutamate--2,6-diaminopimelate ligase